MAEFSSAQCKLFVLSKLCDSQTMDISSKVCEDISKWKIIWRQSLRTWMYMYVNTMHDLCWACLCPYLDIYLLLFTGIDSLQRKIKARIWNCLPVRKKGNVLCLNSQSLSKLVVNTPQYNEVHYQLCFVS